MVSFNLNIIVSARYNIENQQNSPKRQRKPQNVQTRDTCKRAAAAAATAPIIIKFYCLSLPSSLRAAAIRLVT